MTEAATPAADAMQQRLALIARHRHRRRDGGGRRRRRHEAVQTAQRVVIACDGRARLVVMMEMKKAMRGTADIVRKTLTLLLLAGSGGVVCGRHSGESHVGVTAVSAAGLHNRPGLLRVALGVGRGCTVHVSVGETTPGRRPGQNTTITTIVTGRGERAVHDGRRVERRAARGEADLGVRRQQGIRREVLMMGMLRMCMHFATIRHRRRAGCTWARDAYRVRNGRRRARPRARSGMQRRAVSRRRRRAEHGLRLKMMMSRETGIEFLLLLLMHLWRDDISHNIAALVVVTVGRRGISHCSVTACSAASGGVDVKHVVPDPVGTLLDRVRVM